MLYTGLCIGGPCSGKPMYHGEKSHAIGRDRLTKRLIIAWQGGDTEDVEVGRYRFSDGAWHWESPAPSTK